MRYSFAAILALATAVLAQTPGFDVISKPGNFEKVPAASTYTIVWDPKPEHTGTVTLSLIGGKDQKSLQALGPIGKADNSDGKFEWKVAKNLGDQAIYGIQITWDEDNNVFQYSFPFHIEGSGAGASSAPSVTGSITPGSNSTVTRTSSLVSSTPAGNLSSSLTSQFTTVTSTSTPTRTGSSSTSTSTAAAPSNVGSTLALFGGLAMAVFAL
ncbi:Ser-Thr-rich glycosyl-phosphatidyl-inositol-anchored membrane family-domain-containing protein [Cercophora newfieldiana]|uniref:Ser-Thr-rich glycosyl-phosphatidyl-inositol-anchored membrane family-domain-containing protein n=1 Tax=Cercophora newfieldiana TaxID=92897 RepID=A0AA39YRE8_9PEZI|nr:Ser-Thr-rich glycosyl-phosphatidyl-inositol-anchored membrane family-domain-containing protein [Cercophora newfieldiana]